jgi:hypothetical protein
MAMYEFSGTVLLVGVPVAVLTALVVQAMKGLGLEDRWAPLLSVLVAGVFVGLAELSVVASWIEPVSRVLVGALMIGLAASGGYSWARVAGRTFSREEQ